jgi:hypothetical protein
MAEENAWKCEMQRRHEAGNPCNCTCECGADPRKGYPCLCRKGS